MNSLENIASRIKYIDAQCDNILKLLSFATGGESPF
jgi:hypothetical protein